MATSTKFPENAIQTVMGRLNDTESRIPGTYPIHPETTLNTYYKVYQNNNTIVTSAPPLQYFGIGIYGFYNTGDKTECAPHQPSAEECNLYEPIPFRCVPYDEDLTTTERTNYRMRVEQVINGSRYWCYYLKKLELVDNATKIVRIDPATGEEAPYEFSEDWLHPTPRKYTVSGTDQSSTTEIVVVKKVRAILTGAEVYEVINALYDGDLTHAKISEWGLFSGVDADVTGYDSNGVSFTYREAIYAQMAHKLCNIGSFVSGATWNGTREFVLGNGKLLDV